MDQQAYSAALSKEKPVVHPTRALVTAATVGAVGLYCLGRAVCFGEVGWRAIAMIGLSFALGPLSAEIGVSRGQTARFSLAHIPLFASALALGPVEAALPGVFCGISRLLALDSHRPLGRTLYDLLKPTVITAAASAAYLVLGGSRSQPQAADSLLPVMGAGVVYAGLSAILVGLMSEPSTERQSSVPATSAIAGWLGCLTSGYALGVLYASAPGYVMLAAAGSALVLSRALSRRQELDVTTEEMVESTDPAETDAGCVENADAIRVDEGGPASFVDPATGLASRRYVEMFLAREISRAMRLEHPVSVAVFDIDGSRGLGDGSLDEFNGLLADIGSKLKSGLRDYDVLGRYSEQRLILLLPECDTDQALEVVSRLHASFGSLALGRTPVTVSAGVATCPDDADSAEDLVNAAHHALNRGRFLGPNAVHLCEELDEAS